MKLRESKYGEDSVGSASTINTSRHGRL